MDALDFLPVPQRTWHDEDGRVVASLLGDGQLIAPAPSRVGTTVKDDGVEFEVVWDGAKEKKGTTTKGELLGSYQTKVTIYDILRRNADLANR
jgi:hypothetical protein